MPFWRRLYSGNERKRFTIQYLLSEVCLGISIIVPVIVYRRMSSDACFSTDLFINNSINSIQTCRSDWNYYKTFPGIVPMSKQIMSNKFFMVECFCFILFWIVFIIRKVVLIIVCLCFENWVFYMIYRSLYYDMFLPFSLNKIFLLIV